ncbi:MAG: type II secretion system F family protein [Candidatus Vogelbacteria bacterium]|nr:type II secretion system F family protein [Candidatus Vogelbacteria bacterium]
MLFNYEVTTKEGQSSRGSIEAPTVDIAIGSLQKRGYIILSITSTEKVSFLRSRVTLFGGVKQKDIVILARQLSTLFGAKVSALDAIQLVAEETTNIVLQDTLANIAGDIKGGIPISQALSRYPAVFSTFMVSMVRSGEESGKLAEVFEYLAAYLERNFELKSKARNALLYPAFVVTAFVGVIVVMLTYVIPNLSAILLESGQELPLYTRFVLAISSLLVNYGILILVLIIIAGLVLARYATTAPGRYALSEFKLALPFFGKLYRKLYLARIADNMNTMLSSGISMVRAVEVTSDVVGNDVYRNILREAGQSIKSGTLLSESLARNPAEIPSIMVQMARIGEETGELGFVLDTMARFYKREVESSVDTLVTLIEPIMIVLLGIGVGFLLVSVLGPIYNLTSSF